MNQQMSNTLFNTDNTPVILQGIQEQNFTITTLEVAEMMETRHSDVLLKLEGQTKSDGTIKTKGIIQVLTERNFPLSDYFKESTYIDPSGKSNKCYDCTKMGCELLANKFTGEKGILFTARYVKKFDEMEQKINNQYKLPTTYKEALIQLLEKVEENEKLITCMYLFPYDAGIVKVGF